MLQIVTGMYFREHVPRRVTMHRAVFYTNSTTLRSARVDLPVGSLLWDTSWGSAVSAVTVEATEQLEAERPDGQTELLVSTNGRELLDDLTSVLAFTLDVSFSRSQYQLEHMVPDIRQPQPMRGPAGILARTFDAGVYVDPDSFDDVRVFMNELVGLQRSAYDVAMRAIRRVGDASLLAGDDPTTAYTLYVAALESLTSSASYPAPAADWDRYDSAKGKIVDKALVDVPAEQAAKVRAAVLQVDQLSLRQRFAACTLAHITSAFFREEAVGAVRPIRGVDLPRALDIAYQFRSRNVHTLQALAPELWNATMRAETLPFEGVPALSLQGLKRLTRHVVREYVRRAPRGIDESFDYRENLPGQIRMQMAPQYWVWQPAGLTAATAPKVVEGFVELLLPLLAGGQREEGAGLPDMRLVMQRCEALLSGETRAAVRQPLSLLYLLWHLVTDPSLHRPNATMNVERYERDLDEPSMYGFVIRVLTSHAIEWPTEDLITLVRARDDSLRWRKGTTVPLPSRVDAALLVAAAERLWDDDDEAQALLLLARAVELVPGDLLVIALETAARAGAWPGVDLFDFVTATGAWSVGQPGAEPEDDQSEDEQTKVMGADEPRGEAKSSDGGS